MNVELNTNKVTTSASGIIILYGMTGLAYVGHPITDFIVTAYAVLYILMLVIISVALVFFLFNISDAVSVKKLPPITIPYLVLGFFGAFLFWGTMYILISPVLGVIGIVCYALFLMGYYLITKVINEKKVDNRK